MTIALRSTFSVAVIATLLASACGGSSGPRKIVVSQSVCGNVKFLKMAKDQTNRLILDNSSHDPNQGGMNLVLTKFPVAVKGDVPPNSTIGAPFSTIKLHAKPGDQASVDLQPTFTGTYKATCQIIEIKPNGAGQQIIEQPLQFRLE